MEFLYLDRAPEHIVNYFDIFLEESLNNPKLVCKQKTNTINGKQSINLIDNLDKNLRISFTNEFLMPVVKDFLGLYTISGIDFDYLHVIKYNKGGKQNKHTHNIYEDYSFILYLNDCEGHTIFYPSGGDPKLISPKRGKIVVFPSYLVHEATISTIEKRVVVGSIREIGKVWNKR